MPALIYKTMIDSLFKTITKPRFIIALIVLTLIAVLLGVLIPQVSDKGPSYFEEWKLTSPKIFYIVNLLQLNRVYTSVWFLALVFIILLALGYSLYQQIKRNIKVHRSKFTVHDSWLMVHSDNEQSTINDERIIKFMKKKGYRLVQSSPFMTHSSYEQSTINNKRSTVNDEHVMVFSKNSISRWGGAVFHSGLFMIILAALVGLAFQKRGFVQVMEGEVFSGRHEDFLVRDLGVFQKRFDVGFKTQLYKFNHEYWETDQIKDISSLVAIIDKDGKTKEKTINVNSPLKYNGINIYQSFDYGYALTFVLKRPNGKETVTHFLLDRPDRKTKPFVGNSDFPQTPYIFKMKFYPDISMNSFYLGKPILYLQVFRQVHSSPFTVHGNDERTATNNRRLTVSDELIFEGLVIPGNVMNIEGNLVRFHGISHWSGLIYVKGFDVSIAYIGFFISCIGASIIFLLPYKEIFISQKGSVLSLYGRTNRYNPLFKEEMEKIKEELNEQ